MPKVRYKKPRRRGGKTVYRARRPADKRKRSRTDSVIKGIFAAIGLVLLVFIGYSIGAPIHRYLSEKKAAADTDVRQADNTAIPEGLPDTTASSADDTAPDTTLEVTEKEEAPADHVSNEILNAAAVSVEAMCDRELLAAELERIRSEGCNGAVFTLKATGGAIYYNTQSSFASFADDAIKSDIYADELSDAARAAGLIPVARISLLEDNNSYGKMSFGSYKTADGELWYNSEGKTMLSPFDANTIDYIEDIADEAASSGFDYLICSDVYYPEFEMSDYSELGEAYGYGDRYMALVRAANAVSDAAEKYGCRSAVEVTSSDLLAGRAEVVHPEELRCGYVSVIFDNDSSADDVRSAIGGKKIISSFISSDGKAPNSSAVNGRIVY